MSWSMSATSMVSSPAIRTLLRDDGLLVLELPEVEESFRLGSPAILWEEHVNYFTPALAEHMLRRFGFEICDRRSYVFGGGSMAFVAQEASVLRSPARSSFPIRRPTIELLRRFAGGIERQKAELSGLVVARPVERLPGARSMAPRRAPACWHPFARLPTRSTS